MSYRISLLVKVMRDPLQVRLFVPAQWDILIRQARHANLLGRLFYILSDAGVLGDVPDAPYHHLQAGAYLAQRQYHSVCHEIEALRIALGSEEIALILLKGAAYSAAGLPAATGRIFADVDILIPRMLLGTAEATLMKFGWVTAPINAYDQQYYRRWMHELPPMQHLERGSVLDVHHTILPPTARYHPDPVRLIVDKVSVEGVENAYVLCPVDMVLHAATHLFHEGESDNALRDLSDLDILLRHFSCFSADTFWAELVDRAEVQELTRPLWLALYFCIRVFSTPVPVKILSRHMAYQPGWLMERMYDAVFQPQHVTTTTGHSALARRMLYIRGHWLRMPVHLLTAHLLRKALTPETARAEQR